MIFWRMSDKERILGMQDSVYSPNVYRRSIAGAGVQRAGERAETHAARRRWLSFIAALHAAGMEPEGGHASIVLN